MLNKKVLKDIQSLGLKKRREETGLFLAEATEDSVGAIEGYSQKIDAVYATASWKEIVGETISVTEISEAELQRFRSYQHPTRLWRL